MPASPTQRCCADLPAVAHLQVAGGDLYPPARARRAASGAAGNARDGRSACRITRAVAGDEQAVGPHAHRAGSTGPRGVGPDLPAVAHLQVAGGDLYPPARAGRASLALLTMSEMAGAPSREMSRRSARTLTVPASPAPKVVALITPPVRTCRSPAVTSTRPPAPVEPLSVRLVMPVESAVAPSREMSRRSARTLTVPAAPAPEVLAADQPAVAHLQVAGGDHDSTTSAGAVRVSLYDTVVQAHGLGLDIDDPGVIPFPRAVRREARGVLGDQDTPAQADCPTAVAADINQRPDCSAEWSPAGQRRPPRPKPGSARRRQRRRG